MFEVQGMVEVFRGGTAAGRGREDQTGYGKCYFRCAVGIHGKR
jgi:hypothetical protein